MLLLKNTVVGLVHLQLVVIGSFYNIIKLTRCHVMNIEKLMLFLLSKHIQWKLSAHHLCQLVFYYFLYYLKCRHPSFTS